MPIWHHCKFRPLFAAAHAQQHMIAPVLPRHTYRPGRGCFMNIPICVACSCDFGASEPPLTHHSNTMNIEHASQRGKLSNGAFILLFPVLLPRTNWPVVLCWRRGIQMVVSTARKMKSVKIFFTFALWLINYIVVARPAHIENVRGHNIISTH